MARRRTSGAQAPGGVGGGPVGREPAAPETSFTPEQRALLSRHVSNLDRDVYVIFNLPEEVIAVIFAYVSRSPRSFRENLLRLLEDPELALLDAPAAPAAPGQQEPGGAYAFAAEKARQFHEKWVVGYGHASVAELAKAAVGIERISRLASARLETANPWLSFIEYSQRYQMPRRGAYVVPPELAAAGDRALLERFHQVQDATYEAYLELFEGLVRHLERTEPPRAGEGERARRSRLEKMAFEDARYALTLAVHTNLGMVGNGRALRDMIVHLLSDPYEETTRLALAIREEVTKVLPTLVRYAEPNAYRMEAERALAEGIADVVARYGGARVGSNGGVRLLDWTGRLPEEPAAAAAGTAPAGGAAGLGRREGEDQGRTGLQEQTSPAEAAAGAGQVAAAREEGGAAGAYREESGASREESKEHHEEAGAYPEASTTPDELRALDRLLGAWLTQHGELGWPETEVVLARMTPAEKLDLFDRAVRALGPHDPPQDALKFVRYVAEFNVSEANWHQLLRHSRRVHFAAQAPTVEHGIVVPPRVQEAGLAHVLVRAVDASERLYHELVRAGLPLAAHYVVTNAHRRRVRAEFDLWQLYHLINLRGKPEAQWDIRRTVHELARQVMRVHPNLIARAPVLMRVLEGGPGPGVPPARG